MVRGFRAPGDAHLGSVQGTAAQVLQRSRGIHDATVELQHQRIVVCHRLPGQSHDDVTHHQASRGGRALGFDARDQQAGGLPLLGIRGQLSQLAAHAQVAALHAAMLLDGFGNLPGLLGGNGHQAAPTQAGGVDAQHLALIVHQRAAGETGVGGGIRAQRAFHQAAAVRAHRPPDGADDAQAGFDGLAGAAQRDGQLAHLRLLIDARRRAERIDELEHGEIAVRVTPQQLGAQGGTIGQADLDVALLAQGVAGGKYQPGLHNHASGRQTAAAMHRNDGCAGRLGGLHKRLGEGAKALCVVCVFHKTSFHHSGTLLRLPANRYSGRYVVSQRYQSIVFGAVPHPPFG